MLTGLELLRRMERTLSDPDVKYVFAEWSQCTCGHVYLAAHGRMAASHSDMQGPAYRAAIIAVASALGYTTSNARAAEVHVSRLTSQEASRRLDEASRGTVEFREAALRIVREGIAKVEAEHEAARLKVIDEHTFGLRP